MKSIDIKIEIACQICNKWKSSDTISVDENNMLPNVLNFFRQEIAKHQEHGIGGKWQINYSRK